MLRVIFGGVELLGAAGSLGEHFPEHETGAEQRDVDGLRREFQRRSDAVNRVAFDISQEKNQALGGGQVDESGFEIGALDVALLAKSGTGGDWRSRRGRLEFHVLLQFGDQRYIDLLGGGFIRLLEGADEGIGENVFGLELPAGHIKGDGEDTMAMAFVGIPALLRGGNLSEVQDQPCIVGFKSAQEYSPVVLKIDDGLKSDWRQLGCAFSIAHKASMDCFGLDA